MFSRHAVTCLRDGKLCLMFRVGDLRDKSHIIGAAISAQVIRRKVTEEGEIIPYYHQALPVRFDETGTDIFLIWPVVIIHEINEKSPFYMVSHFCKGNLYLASRSFGWTAFSVDAKRSAKYEDNVEKK